MVQLRLVTGFLLIVLVMIVGFHALPAANDDFEEAIKRDFSWACTSGCTSYQKCRLQSFGFGNCKPPSGCNCNSFFWEG